jgi:two-component system, NarL family, sensor histidine kinase DegS
VTSTPKLTSENQGDQWEAFVESLKAEYEAVQREIKELSLMTEHSQVEVGKLTQRNATCTVQIQQNLGQIDNLPRADIRSAYENALDAQQRLFVMRGQLDKLQSDKNQLTRHLSTIEKALALVDSGAGGSGARRGISPAAHTVEMMIQAQESERQRLARQMHDGPAQALTNLILQSDIAMRLFDRDPTMARDELENLKTSATSTFQKVRNFISELRPMMLDDLGLPPTLSRYVDVFMEQSGLDVRLNISGMDQRIENYLEVMIFRAVQELLVNTTRHSSATLVKLQIDAAPGQIRVSIDDNGSGFDVDAASKSSGMGLKVIRDRVEMLGGEMEIDSVVGQGTRIVFTVPTKGVNTT